MKNSELEKIAARVFKANPTATKVLVAANGVAFVGENEHHAEVYAEQQRLALTTVYKTGAAPTDDAEELATLKEQLAVSDENLKTTQESLEVAQGIIEDLSDSDAAKTKAIEMLDGSFCEAKKDLETTQAALEEAKGQLKVTLAEVAKLKKELKK